MCKSIRKIEDTKIMYRTTFMHLPALPSTTHNTRFTTNSTKMKTSVVTRDWGIGKRNCPQGGKEKLSDMMKTFYILILMMITWLWAHVKIYRTIYLKRGNYISIKSVLKIKCSTGNKENKTSTEESNIYLVSSNNLRLEH